MFSRILFSGRWQLKLLQWLSGNIGPEESDCFQLIRPNPFESVGARDPKFSKWESPGWMHFSNSVAILGRQNWTLRLLAFWLIRFSPLSANNPQPRKFLPNPTRCLSEIVWQNRRKIVIRAPHIWHVLTYFFLHNLIITVFSPGNDPSSPWPQCTLATKIVLYGRRVASNPSTGRCNYGVKDIDTKWEENQVENPNRKFHSDQESNLAPHDISDSIAGWWKQQPEQLGEKLSQWNSHAKQTTLQTNYQQTYQQTDRQTISKLPLPAVH